jgi:1-hydroxycarotenoid 3,4-desaturase
LSQEVVVVGAGVGGLAAALRLARAGLSVTVVDEAAAPGGKIRELEVAGARIDSGPTVLTMKWVFDELFESAGARFEDRVGLTQVEVLARHAWSEQERLDLFSDPARTADAIGTFAGAAAARGFLAFRSRAAEVYRTLEKSFIRAPRPTPLGLFVSAGGMGGLLRIKPFETLWRELGKFFEDSRLRQLFGRYATYCGSSPFLAPATLMLVAHVELEGVWRVTGGMQRLPEAMARLASERGVCLRASESVTQVELKQGRVAGVILAGGDRLAANAVVLNADVSALGQGLFGAALQKVTRKVTPEERSLSALTLSMYAPTQGFPLSHHNVFFCSDSEAEFSDVFSQRRLPREPTVYLCAQDRGDDGFAGNAVRAGPEKLFCIINAPATGDTNPFAAATVDACVERGLDRLKRSGLHLQPSSANCRVTSPADFERRFPGTGGALYGPATHGAMATFQRSGSRTRIPRLYLAGGSVHPGPGVPMAALSGSLAAQCVLEDLTDAG